MTAATPPPTRGIKVPWLLRAAVRLGSVVAPRTTTARALDLFCTPFASSRTRAEAADLAGATVGQIAVGPHLINTYCWGPIATAPKVLCSHGWSSFGLRFVPWVAHLLQAGYAVVAFDQPGHGRNAKARISLPGFADTVRAVGSHFGHFAAGIGHSLGGAALAVAMRDGFSVAQVLLLAPAADGAAATRRFANLVQLPERRLIALQRLLESRSGRSLESIAIQQIGPNLSQRALIVHDPADAEVPWEEGECYARVWPGAHLLNVLGLGHHHIVTDAAVIRAGLDFLRGEVVGAPLGLTPAQGHGVA
jgi:pimeloyl-ACP methyl ester carboxylesterase